MRVRMMAEPTAPIVLDDLVLGIVQDRFDVVVFRNQFEIAAIDHPRL